MELGVPALDTPRALGAPLKTSPGFPHQELGLGRFDLLLLLLHDSLLLLEHVLTLL